MVATLQTTKIAHNNGTDAISIDNSGNVDVKGYLTIQKVPACMGNFTGITTTQSGDTVCGLDNSTSYSFSNGGLTIDTANSKLIVPVAGVYRVSAQRLTSGTGGIYFQILHENSNVGQGYASGPSYTDITVTTLLDCAANDEIVFNYNGAVTYAWGGQHGIFAAELVG